MRVYRDRPLMRVLGTVLGTGFVVIGAYALLGDSQHLAEPGRERAVAFGITAIIGGIAAIIASWFERKLDQVWCAHPRRRPWRR